MDATSGQVHGHNHFEVSMGNSGEHYDLLKMTFCEVGSGRQYLVGTVFWSGNTYAGEVLAPCCDDFFRR